MADTFIFAFLNLPGGRLAGTPQLETFQQILNDPLQLGVRLGLTVAILLAALIISPRVGAWAAKAPAEVSRRRANSPNGRAFVLAHAGEAPPPDEPNRLGPWLSRLTRLCIWTAALAALALIWLAGQDTELNGQQFFHAFVDFAFKLGLSVVALALTLVLARVAQRASVASLHASRLNRNLVLLGGRLIYLTTLVIGVIVILAIWGTGLVLPVTLVGILTVALSLSLQDILKNLVAGVYLLIERPFVIGDYITITPYSGEVEDIQLRVTSLRTIDGERVLIPNAMLFTSAVVNLSAFQRRRVSLVVSLPSGPESVSRAEERILSALDAAPSILDDPAPLVTVSRATPEKIDLRVVFWTPTQGFGRTGGGDVLSRAIEELRSQLPEAEVGSADATAPAPA